MDGNRMKYTIGGQCYVKIDSEELDGMTEAFIIVLN